EVAPVFELHAGREPEIHLIDQRSGLQRVPPSLAAHAGGGHLAQLAVDLLVKTGECLPISAARCIEQSRDFVVVHGMSLFPGILRMAVQKRERRMISMQSLVDQSVSIS